jgi:phospholipase C
MAGLENIDHIVVLMLENRSFDHMLGFLKRDDPRIDGLNGAETIPSAPGAPTSHPVGVSAVAAPINAGPDPGHDIGDVREQIYGAPGADFPPAGDNDGFVVNYARRTERPDDADAIMQCFAPDHVPVLSTLARQFALCDGWFASLPGPTWPNRAFVHAGTSAGHVDNGFRIYHVPTIFERLQQAGRSWRIYYHDIPQTLVFPYVQRHYFAFSKMKPFDYFPDDVRGGRLADYTFIEPRYFDAPARNGDRPLPALPANDEHPDHDVRLGEALIADVYEALRASKRWPGTLLFVVYDEHGGFYDHVFPKPAVVPDESPSSGGFDFTRLGVRVPAIVVSPWIEPGTLDRERDAGGQEQPVVRDHTSILATVARRFGTAPLTARDAAAADVGSLLTRATARLTAAEAPLRLPRSAVDDVAQPFLARSARRQPADVPLTDFQQNLLHLVAHVSLAKTTGTAPTTARRSAVPTTAMAAPQLVHAASLTRRPPRSVRKTARVRATTARRERTSTKRTSTETRKRKKRR